MKQQLEFQKMLLEQLGNLTKRVDTMGRCDDDDGDKKPAAKPTPRKRKTPSPKASRFKTVTETPKYREQSLTQGGMNYVTRTPVDDNDDDVQVINPVEDDEERDDEYGEREDDGTSVPPSSRLPPGWIEVTQEDGNIGYIHTETHVQRSTIEKAWEYENKMRASNNGSGPPSIVLATPRRNKKRRNDDENDENCNPNSQISDLGNSPSD